MTNEEAEQFTRRYREAITKGLGCKSWEEALTYLNSIGVDVSNPDLRSKQG